MIDNVEDLDTVIPIYNLLEYSNKYSMSSESLWNYHREEIDDGFDDDASEGRSCKYKTKILGKNRKSLKIGVAIPLKLISKF